MNSIQVLTSDICLEDLPHQPAVMQKIARDLQDCIALLRTNGVEDVLIYWREINDKDCAIDGTIGFFTVSGSITKGKT
jgi:hypothetical protein